MELDTEHEARDQAVARLQKKRKFFVDLTSYATVNGVLWLIWALTDRSVGDTMPWRRLKGLVDSGPSGRSEHFLPAAQRRHR